MNWLTRIYRKNGENKDLVREVHERSNETVKLVTEIHKVKSAIENDPLPNFPVSGFLVGAVPRVGRRRSVHRV